MPDIDPRLNAARRLVAHVGERLGANLSVQLWNGEVLPLGPDAPHDIRIVVARPDAIRRLLLRPGLTTVFQLVGAGDLTIEGGSPLDAADRWDHAAAVSLARRLDKRLVLKCALPFLLRKGDPAKSLTGVAPAWTADDGVGADRTRRRDGDFIRFHYDVGNDFYGLFLDPEMVYSSAVFPDADATLEDAQTHKLELICRKLRLRPGQRLLDIGCGWAGLACWAARNHGVHVHGVTLSQAQLDYGLARVARLGLQDRVTLELRDYRDVVDWGAYDAVSQVEMFEHLGFTQHDAHFRHVRRLLKPGGLHFHQASIRRDGPAALKPTPTTRAITRFIFPGGELDSLGMTVAGLGKAGFEVLDVETLREHFWKTLRIWSARLYDRRAEAEALAGAPRTRLWLLYFALFAKGFERGAVNVHQTVARKRTPGASGLPMDRALLYAKDARPL
ncbi:MAG: cyclopropane-fatty-acyl-phospholipid synthase family protein [Pseudomonadota bacterium]